VNDRAHWRQVANTIEPSVCGGDAAFLSHYFDHLLYKIVHNEHNVRMTMKKLGNSKNSYCTNINQHTNISNLEYIINKSSAAAEMGDRFARIDMGRKEGVLCPFRRRELGPHPIQCRVGRGLSPYQVAS